MEQEKQKRKSFSSTWNGHIVAVLENQKTGEKQIIETHNIVSDAGDIYYAQSGAAESPTNTFVNLYLGTSVSSPPAKANDYSDLTLQAASEKAPTATYPKTNDGDSDNTGSGTDVVTWTYEYTAGDGPWTGITDGMISIATASGTDPILCHFEFAASFDKDSDTTLKVIVNHNANGV